MISVRLWWTLFGLWVLGVTAISSFQSIQLDPISMGPFAVDRVLHCMVFTIGGLLLATALYHQSPLLRWPRILLLSILILVFYGSVDEFHQSFVPGRSGNDLGDLVADSLGALLGASLARIIYAGHRRSA